MCAAEILSYAAFATPTQSFFTLWAKSWELKGSHYTYQILLTKRDISHSLTLSVLKCASRLQACGSLFFSFSFYRFLRCLVRCGRTKRHRATQPRRAYTFLSHGKPQQQIKSDFMPTTVAQFDHDARVIVIPIINAKCKRCSQTQMHTYTHTHTPHIQIHTAISKRMVKRVWESATTEEHQGNEE